MAELVTKTTLTADELCDRVRDSFGAIKRGASISLRLKELRENLQKYQGISVSNEELADALAAILKDFLERNNPNIKDIGFSKKDVNGDYFNLMFDVVIPDLNSIALPKSG